MNELKIKKCKNCGAIVKVIRDCICDNCGIKCCNEEMIELKPNSVDASFEKHLPNYEIENGMLKIKVNHVMEEDHLIEWISLVTDNKEVTTYLKSGDEAVICEKYVPGAKIYSYCNKHGLWMKEVE